MKFEVFSSTGQNEGFCVFSCGKAIPYSKAPATLLLPCYRPHCFNEPLRKEWHMTFYDIDQTLCAVLAALGHAPANLDGLMPMAHIAAQLSACY